MGLLLQRQHGLFWINLLLLFGVKLRLLLRVKLRLRLAWQRVWQVEAPHWSNLIHHPLFIIRY